MVRLDHVRGSASLFPVEKLEGCQTALLLFGAGFYGANDGIHLLDAGLRATVVDTDRERLYAMAAAYPATWTFSAMDAWEFAREAVILQILADVRWDAVSVDSWTGDIEPRVIKDLPLWCALARKLVTVTVGYGGSEIVAPEGWAHSYFPRSANARWLVLERDHA